MLKTFKWRLSRKVLGRGKNQLPYNYTCMCFFSRLTCLLSVWLTSTSTGAGICCCLQQHINRLTRLFMNFNIPPSMSNDIYNSEPPNLKHWSRQLLANPVVSVCILPLDASKSHTLDLKDVLKWSINHHAIMHTFGNNWCCCHVS